VPEQDVLVAIFVEQAASAADADNRSKSAPAKEIQSARGTTMERVDALDS
jgi:hypothetical protein